LNSAAKQALTTTIRLLHTRLSTKDLMSGRALLLYADYLEIA